MAARKKRSQAQVFPSGNGDVCVSGLKHTTEEDEQTREACESSTYDGVGYRRFIA